MFWMLVLIAGIVLIHEKKITLATTLIFYWIIFCTVGKVFYKQIDIPDKGLVYILSMVLLFYLGSLCIGHRRYRLLSSSRTLDIKSGSVFLKGAMLTLFAVIILSIYRFEYSFLSIHNFLAVSSSVRVTNFGDRSTFEKIAMPFVFSAFALDGYFCAYSISIRSIGKKYKMALPILFLEIVMLGVLTTGKSLLIWAIILWVSGFLSGNQEFLNVRAERDKLLKFMHKHKMAILNTAIVFTACLMIMMFVRTQRELSALLDKMINYGLAQVSCFAIWFSEIGDNSLQYSKGGQLLFGILDELKLSDGLSSNFPLNIELGKRGVSSNIYTVFRCVIEDFSIKGSILFWFISGFFCGIIESKVQSKGRKVIYNGLLLAGYVFVLFSFLISAWHYLSIVLAVIFFYLELFYIKCIRKRGFICHGNI